MNQKDKELLLADLCARLPYKVKIEITWWGVDEGIYMNTTLEPDHIDQLLNNDNTEIKPYLRPMSSMTGEEKKEFQACHCVYELHPDFQPMMCNLANELNMFNWLNAHHFDYRGLIEKGLAIAVTEENNPYVNK